MKKFSHFGRASVHTFRMPLYADGKRMSLYLDCLDGAVLGTGTDGYVFSGRIDRLMVKAVYKRQEPIYSRRRLLRSVRILWLTSLRDADCCMWSSVCPGNQGYVLPDRASAGDT